LTLNTLKNILPSLFNFPKSKLIAFLILSLGYLCIFFLQKPEYFLTDDLDFFLGIIFAPYIIRKVESTPNYRFFGWSILLMAILFFWRSNTFYFFAFGFGMLYLLESFFYKINSLAVLLLVACSAVFRHVANIWTFSIRLEMTNITGRALSFLGFPTEVSGNIIYMNGQPFSVAPACMGLDMLVTGFVLSLLILAYFERKYIVTTPLWRASIFCGIALGLTIFSNLIRLSTLVIFKIMPDHWMHDALGILSLVVYMLLPFFLMMRFFYGKNKTQNPDSTKAKTVFLFSNFKILIASHLLLISLLFWTGRQFSNPLEMADTSFDKIEMEGFQKTIDEVGVLKLENDSLLIYIKPPVHIFQGTHDPRFCWKGSGYKLSKIEQKKFGEHDIYTAILSKGEDQLFTAWWLDNGAEKIIGEWEWRQKMMQGEEGFRMVNITSQDVEILDQAISAWLALRLF
jgi:exosortase N